MPDTILVVDDEQDIRNLVCGILEDEGFSTLQAASAEEAETAVSENSVHLVILDIWLEGSHKDGLEILADLKEKDPILPVIMISGHGTIETAVSAIKDGAYDFIEKPFKSDRLITMAQRAIEASGLKKENLKLKAGDQGPASIQFFGQSSLYKNFEKDLQKVAKTNSRVLLIGEAGTGKTAAARYIHDNSDRADYSFKTLNCAALSADRFEEELFGHSGLGGLLEEAHQGTLLLDEVADLPIESQAKLIKILQDEHYKHGAKGDNRAFDIRFITSTKQDLQESVKSGKLKEDLYYRVHVVPIFAPSLKDCSSDIPEFVEQCVNDICTKSDLPQKSFASSALSVLQRQDWPGNLRQLRNVVEWVLIMSGDKDTITADDLPQSLFEDHNALSASESVAPAITADAFLDVSLKEARQRFEQAYLQSQLERFKGNVSKTAEFIGMERSALHRKLKMLETELGSDSNTPDLRVIKEG